MMSMFLNEATKLRAQTIIKGLEKRNMHGVSCATKLLVISKRVLLFLGVVL